MSNHTSNVLLIRPIGVFLIFSIFLVPIGINQSEALQQTAGSIVFEVQPGEKKTLQWGLVSDNDNAITLEIKAAGEGAELLSFPKTIEVQPRQAVFVDITVTVPADHPNNVQLNPSIYATEFGELGGSTVMNIQMQKILTIKIGTPIIVESKEQPSTSEPEQPQAPSEQPQAPSEQPQAPGTTEIVGTDGTKPGGCLIATAAYGSEMAPQVQMLRELRDDTLLNTASGSAFMVGFNSIYYSFSPTVAAWETENPVFKEAVKITITPLITTLSILNYLNIDSEAEMLGYGIGVIMLNIGMYFVAPTLVIIRLTRQ